jgi:hypothetical protein
MRTVVAGLVVGWLGAGTGCQKISGAQTSVQAVVAPAADDAGVAIATSEMEGPVANENELCVRLSGHQAPCWADKSDVELRAGGHDPALRGAFLVVSDPNGIGSSQTGSQIFAALVLSTDKGIYYHDAARVQAAGFAGYEDKVAAMSADLEGGAVVGEYVEKAVAPCARAGADGGSGPECADTTRRIVICGVGPSKVPRCTQALVVDHSRSVLDGANTSEDVALAESIGPDGRLHLAPTGSTPVSDGTLDLSSEVGVWSLPFR